MFLLYFQPESAIKSDWLAIFEQRMVAPILGNQLLPSQYAAMLIIAKRKLQNLDGLMRLPPPPPDTQRPLPPSSTFPQSL